MALQFVPLITEHKTEAGVTPVVKSRVGIDCETVNKITGRLIVGADQVGGGIGSVALHDKANDQDVATLTFDSDIQDMKKSDVFSLNIIDCGVLEVHLKTNGTGTVGVYFATLEVMIDGN